MPYYLSFFSFSEEVSSNQTLAEKLESILNTGVVGYLLVFVILGLIWFLLAMFSKLFTRNKVKTNTAAPSPASAPLPIAQTETEEEADETELVAVIAAAVSAYTEKPMSGFRVVSFRKKK